MSTTATTGAGEPQPDMQTYVQPHYRPTGRTRSRTNSAASKYVPDGYPIRPSPPTTDSMGFLAPNAQRGPPAQAGGPYVPPKEEQYRPPPAAFTGAVPPAQLPVGYQDNKNTATDGYDHPSTRRRASATSHYSERSRRSSHSHGHRDDGHRHHDHDHHDHGHHHHDHDHDHEHHSGHKKKRHFDDPSENEMYLKRKNTPRRSYGGSLFALFDGIKDALKGN